MPIFYTFIDIRLGFAVMTLPCRWLWFFLGSFFIVDRFTLSTPKSINAMLNDYLIPRALNLAKIPCHDCSSGVLNVCVVTSRVLPFAWSGSRPTSTAKSATNARIRAVMVLLSW